jgi:hypothetical protein
MPAFKSSIQELTIERAYELAAELDECSRTDTEAATVFRGVHAKHGAVYITIPIAGDALLLPTEFHAKPILIQGELAKVA